MGARLNRHKSLIPALPTLAPTPPPLQLPPTKGNAVKKTGTA